MKKSLSEGYYTIIQDTPDRILFTHSVRDRRMTAITLALSALIVWSMSAYCLLRPDKDVPGFIFFLISGLVLLLVALFSLAWWTEIEFNSSSKTIVKRRYGFGREHQLGQISFNQLERIRLDKTYFEYQVTHLKLIGPSGKVWATLPGYVIHNRGLKVRQKLLSLINSADDAQSSS